MYVYLKKEWELNCCNFSSCLGIRVMNPVCPRFNDRYINVSVSSVILDTPYWHADTSNNFLKLEWLNVNTYLGVT
jgi:hypothetical protein